MVAPAGLCLFDAVARDMFLTKTQLPQRFKAVVTLFGVGTPAWGTLGCIFSVFDMDARVLGVGL
jgi:hypothetical protein